MPKRRSSRRRVVHGAVPHPACPGSVRIARHRQFCSRLNETARAVGEVVHLIREIAPQTNCLALIATMHPALAGRVDRSIAVVAAEVESLEIQGQLFAVSGPQLLQTLTPITLG